VVLALRMWRYYLIGNVVHIYTYHKSLKYIFTQLNLNMMKQRWLELIKDCELEVHYHPSKANVVVDTLSRRAYCNYLPSVHLTGEESSTQVLLDLSLYNITLTPILRDEIIAQGRMTRAWPTSREECKKVTQRLLVSTRMRMVPCGSKIDWLCRREKP
jgi:hypothetical protein